ncbi:MAG: zinc-ribbon domain-containing protein [Candidatus Krumholzibacteria bacterium]|nr:zinc-ribbon domain-containing protein [Candidatus Krumholzibacteria bacterium]
MIIQCEGCAAKYFLPESKVPAKPVKVRCPQCKAVFTLIPHKQNVVAGADESVLTSAAKSPEAEVKAQETAQKPAPAPSTPAPKPKAADGDENHARAKRLARVLVSDILCYNQEKRDRALLDGSLMTVLGDEIKKSWELYKDKVGPEVAKSTDYFKEALNEILADGQKVF